MLRSSPTAYSKDLLDKDDWHDSSCRKPDILTGDGFVTCKRCGSFGTTTGTTTPEAGDVTTATPRPTYEPLEEKTDIRLLKVEPGEFDDPIQCSIFLSSTTSNAEYEAISYTWGGEDRNMEKTGRISLGKKTFYVTPSCESALRHIRSKFSPKVVWIDAICINQDDLNERGHQVRVMAQIYSGAQQILIYIGEASPLDEKLCNFLSGKQCDCLAYWQLHLGLAKLFRRRYFSRVWILQEIALARKATLICGRNVLPWPSFQLSRLVELGLLSEGATSLPDKTQLPPALGFRAPVYRDSSDLLGLLDLARNSQATDPRDKIFAVYGLIFFAEKDGLVADYTKSTESVYIDVAAWIARNFGLAMLLARTADEIRFDESTEADMHQWDDSSLPRWAPDWTKRIKPDTYLLTSRLLGYDANSNLMPPKVKPAKASHFITMRGGCFTFPAFKLGSIANEMTEMRKQLKISEGSPITNPWICFEIGTNDVANPRRHTIERHIFSDASDIDEIFLDRNQVYLVPGPADYGDFLFEEPGSVSVKIERGDFIWTHEDRRGLKTSGRFDEYALCCREWDTCEVKPVYGLLRMDYGGFEGVWRTGEFETVLSLGAV